MSNKTKQCATTHQMKLVPIRKRISTVMDDIFSEVMGQYHFQKEIYSLNDQRLSNYLSFFSQIVDTFKNWQQETVSSITKLLDELHFELWEASLFDKISASRVFDSKWLLFRMEQELLGKTDSYTNRWNDLPDLQRQYEYIHAHLTHTPMHKGSIWEIKGQQYRVGVSFALRSDLWLKCIDDNDSKLHQSYRLVDLLPLDENNCKPMGQGVPFFLNRLSKTIIELTKKLEEAANNTRPFIE